VFVICFAMWLSFNLKYIEFRNVYIFAIGTHSTLQNWCHTIIIYLSAMWLSSSTIVTHLAMQCGSRLQSAHICSCNATTRWAHLTHNENSSAFWNSQQTKSTTVIHFQRITAQGQTKQLLTRMNLSIQFASWSVDKSAVAPPSPAQTSHKVTRSQMCFLSKLHYENNSRNGLTNQHTSDEFFPRLHYETNSRNGFRNQPYLRWVFPDCIMSQFREMDLVTYIHMTSLQIAL